MFRKSGQAAPLSRPAESASKGCRRWQCSSRYTPLKDSRRLHKQGVALCGPFTESCCAPLVRHLKRPERRQIPPHEHGLNVVTLNRRIRLEEQFQKEVFREGLIRANDVYPRALVTRVGIQFQALQRILGRQRLRHLVARRSGPQQVVRIEVAAELESRGDRLILTRVVPDVERHLTISKGLLELDHFLCP